DVFVAIGRREDNNPRFGVNRANGVNRVHAVEPGHPQIHECNIRVIPFPKLDGLLSVAGFGHDIHVLLLFDNGDETVTDYRVIFRDEDSYDISSSGYASLSSARGNACRISIILSPEHF